MSLLSPAIPPASSGIPSIIVLHLNPPPNIVKYVSRKKPHPVGPFQSGLVGERYLVEHVDDLIASISVHLDGDGHCQKFGEKAIDKPECWGVVKAMPPYPTQLEVKEADEVHTGWYPEAEEVRHRASGHASFVQRMFGEGGRGTGVFVMVYAWMVCQWRLV